MHNTQGNQKGGRSYRPQQRNNHGFKPHRIRVKFYDILAGSIYNSLVDRGCNSDIADDYVEHIMKDLAEDVIEFGFIKKDGDNGSSVDD